MIPLSLKEEVKRVLKEEWGYRIFKSEVDKYWKVIYPFSTETSLTETKVEYVLNILTRNSFLEKIGVEVNPQIWGGHKRWNRYVEDDDRKKQINECVTSIRNYLKENKEWYLEILEKVKSLPDQKVLKENLIVALESLANFWIFNDINVFKKEIEKFRKNAGLRLDKFTELKQKIESKYKEIFKNELNKEFDFYGLLRRYRYLKIDGLLKIVHDLKNNKEKQNEKRNANVLEFEIEKKLIYIDDLEDFEIKKTSVALEPYLQNEIYETIAFYELTWRENFICDLNKIKNFCKKYKIPERFENLVKNFIFYDYLDENEWYYIFSDEIEREDFCRNFLIFLVKDERLRNIIRKMLKVKETKDYKLFAEIGHYFWLKNWIRESLEKINKKLTELEDRKIKLKGNIEEMTFMILSESSEREINIEKRVLQKSENDLKTTEEKIKKLLEELKITYNFENFEETLKNFLDKFEEENKDILISEDKSRYENTVLQLLWFFVDSIDKFFSEEISKSDFLSILESKQSDFWNQIYTLLEFLGFINNNENTKKKDIQKLKDNIRKSYKKFLKDTVLFPSGRKNSKAGLKNNNL